MVESHKFNAVTEKPLVLISPLDWGLGHTTRCIPVIRELINLNCDVIIACNSNQKTLLQHEFPGITYVQLPGYNIRYGQRGWLTPVHIIFQIPKILIRIKRENRWLQGFLQQYHVDIVIADNRFGLYSKQAPCIFITHQLAIKSGLGNGIDRLLQRLNYRYINRFNTCWVPDYNNQYTIAGELSHPLQFPHVPVRYIGPLSRFTPCPITTEQDNLLIILSGPEPQRSILEEILLQQLKDYTGKAIIVRGVLNNEAPVETNNNVVVYNHVPAATLNQMICNAGIVISRAGYTTVMDLLKLRKKSILIPTPGQTEQEYLASHLHQQQLAYTVQQHTFNLINALAAAAVFSFQYLQQNMEEYKNAISDLICE